ncbi:MAG: S9 family peptidase [Saprospiraceae bacterium]|nr:S9 family peptidase [Saprospiraceae bacterium]
MKRILLLAFCLYGLSQAAFAQKPITLEDIWQDGTFTTRSLPGFNFLKDGRHYTRLEQSKVNQYDLSTGGLVETIFDASVHSPDGFNGRVSGYSVSDDGQKLLILSEMESIYRHSTRSKVFLYDRNTKVLTALFGFKKVMYAEFNPQGTAVAFVYENNLYYQDLVRGKTVQVTKDGRTNVIINGATDWVYEEEFTMSQAYQWSPDGRRIAFMRFDESAVREFTMTNYNNQHYPQYETFKYPKVGEANSVVQIFIHDTKGRKNKKVETGAPADSYHPRIKWTADPEKLCIYHLNRHQNDLRLLLADARTGKTSLLLQETNEYYLDEGLFDDLHFFKNGKQFLWSSEKDGRRHLYLHEMSGGDPRQITQGDWDVTQFYGLDEANQLVYYQANKRNPMEREVYATHLEGKREQRMAVQGGWNSAQFSSTFDFYVVNHSSINTPSSYGVYDKEGRLVRPIEDNTGIRKKQADYGVSEVEFFQFTTSEGVALNGWMIKPPKFNAATRHPVLMFVYGGPGSQQVTDSWKGANYWWFQMLAQQGFVVACVDNRGTGGRGEQFKKMTYLQLGKYETVDQIEAAKYLGTLPYIDPARIGIFGWSYGGYMSSLCILKGAEVFKAAIAVAPVTNWKWYDTIYTERFMRTDKENPSGYADNSPVNFADLLRGKYLLVHGMSDDNVHFQNTAEMANALIDANKQFETYFYPNRNHGIYGGNARLHLFTKMTEFLKSNL